MNIIDKWCSPQPISEWCNDWHINVSTIKQRGTYISMIFVIWFDVCHTVAAIRLNGSDPCIIPFRALCEIIAIGRQE
jgi:hypothetical protein